jgi:hypothetical protein
MGWLNFDDLRAHVAQQHRADRTGYVVTELQNPYAFKRPGHRDILLGFINSPVRLTGRHLSLRRGTSTQMNSLTA